MAQRKGRESEAVMASNTWTKFRRWIEIKLRPRLKAIDDRQDVILKVVQQLMHEQKQSNLRWEKTEERLIRANNKIVALQKRVNELQTKEEEK